MTSSPARRPRGSTSPSAAWPARSTTTTCCSTAAWASSTACTPRSSASDGYGACAEAYGVAVCTATLVDPLRTAPSRKLTKIRLLAGSKGTKPRPVTNTLKVGVSFALICNVIEGWIAVMQAPLELVRHRVRLSGRMARVLDLEGDGASGPVVLTETVIVPPAPTLAVAIPKAPTPVGPGTSTIPLLPNVTVNAMTSGPPADDTMTVFTPWITPAGPAP